METKYNINKIICKHRKTKKYIYCKQNNMQTYKHEKKTTYSK